MRDPARGATIRQALKEEMRDFERWFTGSRKDENGFDLIGALSGRLSEMVGKKIGLDEKTVTCRTGDFFGFGEASR